MPASLQLKHKALPVEKEERERLLHRYFQRHDIDLAENNEGWQVEARWTQNPAYYIDPDIQKGLACWPQALSTSNIPLAVTQDQGFLLGLNDCWSLLSWSLQASAWQQDTPTINLLHLDSHTDLNSPRIALQKDNTWQDLLTGQAFSLDQPQSVVGAIKSGAIGIGSFICPLLASGVNVHVHHLSPKQHFRYAPDNYSLSLALEKNDPIFSSAIRPVLELGQAHSASSYSLSDDFAELCAGIDKRYPCFLHIDLDYFNNRFDGRPDWQGIHDRYDPSIDEIKQRVDAVFSELSTRALRLSDIAIGVSPGFFPVEYWSSTLNYIRQHISSAQAA